jgi:hypothetical protein
MKPDVILKPMVRVFTVISPFELKAFWKPATDKRLRGTTTGQLKSRNFHRGMMRRTPMSVQQGSITEAA